MLLNQNRYIDYISKDVYGKNPFLRRNKYVGENNFQAG